MNPRSLLADDAKAELIDVSPLGIATAQVSKLRRAALGGDADAADALVSIADDAILALVWIWEGYDCDLLSPGFEKQRESLRNILRQIAKKRETWPVLYHCREVQRKKTGQMVGQLSLGTATPLKSVCIEDGKMRHWIQILCYEIGTPTPENAEKWPGKALKWMQSHDGIRTAINDPKTWLYKLANPERQRKKRRTNAVKALIDWESKTRKRHRSRKLSVEEAEQKAARLKKINIRDVVSEGDIVSGLKEAIAAYLKTNINPQI